MMVDSKKGLDHEYSTMTGNSLRHFDLTKFEVASLLSENECKRIYSSINLLDMKCFVDRMAGLSTLGYSSYLDIEHPIASKYYGPTGGTLSSYLAKANQLNPFLRETFKELYSTISDFFSKRFNVECRPHELAALPGFHLYSNHHSFSSQTSHIPHFDGQYEMLLPIFSSELSRDKCFNKTLSFTLPISLPSCYSGIRFWEFHYKDVVNSKDGSLAAKLSTLKPNELRYEIGTIVYHSGHLLHQIKAWSAKQLDAPRVTLQGHGLLVDDILYLYW